MADTYVCAMCGGEFNEGWSKEEAAAECRELFGDLRPEECDVVCDDCFQKIHPENHPHEVEEAVVQTLHERKVNL